MCVDHPASWRRDEGIEMARSVGPGCVVCFNTSDYTACAEGLVGGTASAAKVKNKTADVTH